MLNFSLSIYSLPHLIIIRVIIHPQGAAQSLRLAAPDAFAYLRCSACYTIDDVDDREEFKVWNAQR